MSFCTSDTALRRPSAGRLCLCSFVLCRRCCCCRHRRRLGRRRHLLAHLVRADHDRARRRHLERARHPASEQARRSLLFENVPQEPRHRPILWPHRRRRCRRRPRRRGRRRRLFLLQHLLPRLAHVERRRHNRRQRARHSARHEAVHQRRPMALPAPRRRHPRRCRRPPPRNVPAACRARPRRLLPPLAPPSQPVAPGLVPPPVQRRKGHVAPQGETQPAPQRAVSAALHHLAHARQRLAEAARTPRPRRAPGPRLHARAEQLDRADGQRRQHARARSGHQRRRGVADARATQRTRPAAAQPVVTGEVDDVGGHGHDERGAETSPERGEPFMPRDLAKTVHGGVYRAALSLFDSAFGSNSGRGVGVPDGKVGLDFGSAGGAGGAGDTKGGVVVDPEDLATAGRHAEIGREVAERRWCGVCGESGYFVRDWGGSML